jgi:formate C-acetyltransferase
MKIDVRQFVYDNITPYDGDESFLSWPSTKTKKLREKCKKLLKKEIENGGVLVIDEKTISTITSHAPGYIDKDLELIFGLQTDKPLKRAIKPFGGYRIVEKACQENWKILDSKVKEIFVKYRKSHNDGIFDVYTDKIRTLRKTGVLTWLPDNYSRWRIIWDYRRLALYWIDFLIKQKQEDQQGLDSSEITEELIRLREEISEQIRALNDIKEMAKTYGFDVSWPAKNAQEAIQWTYFAFLSAIKEQDGAAMSLWNVSSFFDIYIQKDIKKWILNEEKAQELVDQFIIKLRLVRQLRMSEYNHLFAGDPTWTTEVIWWMFADGKHKVTKTSFRFLQSLYNLWPAPEPNMTILWSSKLPQNFKKFVAKVSIATSSLQYENDDMMRQIWKVDDYSIACCVSQLETGKWMQFFGARCNMAKALLLAINGWKDEKTWIQVFDDIDDVKWEYLDYDQVWNNFQKVLAELAQEYVKTMNIIHYMHDKYYYEKAQMAFMDSVVTRLMAFGAAWLSVVADSLSAIKYAKVKVKRNKEWLSQEFEIKWDFPKYGNDDDRADDIAKELVKLFITELRKHKIYRDATATLSILTITANVVYGKKTWATPDGRKAGEPFAPWANPMHGRDENGAIASLNSVAKISYKDARDGISNTFSIVPTSLGIDEEEQKSNLSDLLDWYFKKKWHHLNVNVLNRETLLDAMEHPELYPQLTIRVSGYAVNFVKLSREQQKEVIARTFHSRM